MAGDMSCHVRGQNDSLAIEVRVEIAGRGAYSRRDLVGMATASVPGRVVLRAHTRGGDSWCLARMAGPRRAECDQPGLRRTLLGHPRVSPSAYRLPAAADTLVGDSISLVNAMRLVLRHYL